MESVTFFFEPVFFIGFSLLLIVVLIKYDRIKYSLKILYLAIAFYILVATPLGANFLVSQLEVTDIDQDCMNNDNTIDTVVILAGGITGDPYSANEIWRLKEETYRRVLLGLEIAEKIKSKKIIVSGGYGQQFPEAVIMATLIKKIGYSGKVITDTKSKSTHASAINVTKILVEHNIKKYWLVTSSLHMLRAERSFSNQGVLPCQYPVNSQYIDTFFPGSVLPQISALEKSTAAFHEIIGLLWYRLTGKI